MKNWKVKSTNGKCKSKDSSGESDFSPDGGATRLEGDQTGVMQECLNVNNVAKQMELDITQL